MHRILVFVIYVMTQLLLCGIVRAEPPSEAVEFFERKVRPLLSARCYECHSRAENVAQGGLELDSRARISAGGDLGPAIVAGQPEASPLIQAVRYEGELQMPPDERLSPAEVETLEKWVRSGAAMPAAYETNVQPEAAGSAAARDYWAFRPVARQTLPAQSTWITTRIDAFTLARMQSQGLSPAPRADRRTLIRRLYFDLIGLPPTPEQVQEFITDDSPTAYVDLVESLLASPAYGERWARMWLDKARYTDRTASWLEGTGRAFLYRDWVVNAFNADMPYDEFVRRQLATDLMESTGPEDLPALGFISLSPTYWKELKLPAEIIKVIVADEWEEKVDAVSRTFLGLTVACARCHDHKFDPITSQDYYALAGVFASCRPAAKPMLAESLYAPVREAKQRVEALQAKIEELKKSKPVAEEQIDQLVAEIAQLEETTPHYHVPMVNALEEQSLYVVRAGETAQEGTRLDYRAEPRNLPLFQRGDPNRPGAEVPRGFLQVLSPHGERLPFREGSGRLELANAMTQAAAPLLARVIVNRIWMEHFGRGLVTTPSNFGDQGDRPSHPQLLDDLAARFIESGWSIKMLHREIVYSATWQQTSTQDFEKSASDPDNRFLARMNRRRLTFEAWRDTMLCATGSLDFQQGGPSVDWEDETNQRRTLYGTIHRREMPVVLQLHDFPDPTQHSPQRIPTTTPLQGLYALNGPLLLQQAERLVQRLRADCLDSEQERIERAYWLLFQRAPQASELELAKQFLQGSPEEDLGSEGRQWDERWRQYAQVLLAANELLFVD